MQHKTIFHTLLAITLVLAAGVVRGQAPAPSIPDNIRAFIGKDMTALTVESGDLNGDGTTDHILVVENAGAAADEGADDRRVMLILVTGPDGKLMLAKQNNRVILCRSCGGAFGDPFDGVFIEGTSFTIHNYGGSWWRWSLDLRFKYSRRDRTWQLVEVYKEDYDSHDPNTGKATSRTPRSFGKIDIADFDPDKLPKRKARRRAR